MKFINELNNWYKAQCDGDWEHSYGIKVYTLDNPGWALEIDLRETRLAGREFNPVTIELSNSDWIACKVEDGRFLAYGDVGKLENLVALFFEWASQDPLWLSLPDPPTQAQEDSEFLAKLETQPGPEQCEHKDCTLRRVKNSVMCKRHHFEMITGRSPACEVVE